jgi:hypothetical protein
MIGVVNADSALFERVDVVIVAVLVKSEEEI